MAYNIFMRMRKKKWVDPFLESENNYLIKTKEELSNIEKKIYLEIGMGMGDFITESAGLNPDIFYIGFEKDPTCVARAIKKAEDLELNNFKVILGDAARIDELFLPGSIDRIYLHFSDPWPKKGHHKRRLTYNSFLDKYISILRNNGDLIFKTDNQPFFEDSLEYFDKSAFKAETIDRDYHRIVRSEPMTGYERKFVELGQPINYAKFVLSGNED